MYIDFVALACHVLNISVSIVIALSKLEVTLAVIHNKQKKLTLLCFLGRGLYPSHTWTKPSRLSFFPPLSLLFLCSFSAMCLDMILFLLTECSHWCRSQCNVSL